jgi:hypothetical protein
VVERLERHQGKLNTRAEKDPLTVRLLSTRHLLFPPQCPACGAPGTRRVEIEKHCRFTIHTGDGPAEAHQVARLDVILCSACAERHGSEMKRVDRAQGTETSVSRTIEYLVNPRTDFALGSPEPAWHAFRFPSAEYATKFRELNAGLIWTPAKYAREGADLRRSSNLQLLILVAFAAALALWSYLTR